MHDVAIQSLPVRFAIDRAGLVGADGSTHAGSFDLTYLSTLPNFVVMAASDEAELVKMINTSVEINDRPSAIRYPRGTGVGAVSYTHLRAHETVLDLVCRLLLEKKKNKKRKRLFFCRESGR